MSEEQFYDHCGVVGVWLHTNDAVMESKSGEKKIAEFPAANYAYLALHSLQHRGQESAGIVANENGHLRIFRHMGLVQDVFTKDVLKRLKGMSAIGHVRYSTAGDSSIKNAQPFLMNFAGGQLAIAHNGNLTNAAAIRAELEREGHIFQSSSDTEVVMHLIAKSRRKTLAERIADALDQVEGAYSIVMLSDDSLIAARDPFGFRPLALGQLGEHSWIISSESCAFSLVDAKFVREIEPGEMIIIDGNGELHSFFPFDKMGKRKDYAMCIFEWIYFARPDSVINGRSVYEVRLELGRQLAREDSIEADIVIPVPDSGLVSALGYSEESGIPFAMGLMRNHYVGRTFIEPAQQIRQFGVRLKLSPVHSVLNGKRVIVIDDSIVRGTTSAKIINMIKSAGAKEVHMRITSAPVVGPCHFGIDTPNKEELIAARKNGNIEEIAQEIGADSLAYISLEGMINSVGLEGNPFCIGCFTGKYPLPVPETNGNGKDTDPDMFAPELEE